MNKGDIPKEEAERLAREVAQRMLTTPKKAASQKRGGESMTKPLKGKRQTTRTKDAA